MHRVHTEISALYSLQYSAARKFSNDIRNLDNLLVRYHPTLAPWILYFVLEQAPPGSLRLTFYLLPPRTCNVRDCWIVKGCSYCIWDLVPPSHFRIVISNRISPSPIHPSTFLLISASSSMLYFCHHISGQFFFSQWKLLPFENIIWGRKCERHVWYRDHSDRWSSNIRQVWIKLYQIWISH